MAASPETAAPTITITIAGRRAVVRACPACGARDTATVESYSETPWTLERCLDCGFVYIPAAPVYEDLADAHAWEKTAVHRHEERKRRHPVLYRLSKSTRWRLHLFKRRQVEDLLARYASGGNVIDIGCGKGSQLRKLPERYTPFGIEVSRAEAARAVDFVEGRGGKVIVDSAVDGLDAFADDFAAGVFMRSYLEHEADPGRVLAGCHRVLAPGGVAIIKVPNYGSVNRRVLGRKWSGFRFPDHLNYFTPDSLRRMCEARGFAIERFGVMDRFPLSDNMWLIARK